MGFFSDAVVSGVVGVRRVTVFNRRVRGGGPSPPAVVRWMSVLSNYDACIKLKGQLTLRRG